MSEKRVTRRTALKAGAGSGIAAVLAGCLDDAPIVGDDGDGGSASLEGVPSSATGVVYLDAGGLLEDDLVEQGVNRSLEVLSAQGATAPPAEDYQDMLSMAESEVGLDPMGLQSVLFFTDSAGSTAGLLFEADWSEDDIVGAIEDQGTTLTERAEDGHTIYAGESGQDGLAALADGRYLFGEEGTITAVLSVLSGDADSVDGPLADAYADTSGLVRFAADVRDTDVSETTEELSSMEDATTLSGSLTASEDTRAFTLEVSTDDADSATDLAEEIDAIVTLAESQIDQYPEIQEIIDDPERHLDTVAVSQSGSTVTITYSGSVDLVAEGGMVVLAAVVGSFVLGLGQSVEQPSPMATFGFNYDADAGAVTITHQAGDTIDGSNLYVRGATGNSMIDAQWATDYGVDEVKAGTSITVGNVTEAFELRAVWDPADRGQSAVLSSFTGPGA